LKRPTGDARQAADAVVDDLGIDVVFTEVLPEDKDKAVAELQERGERVAMVGDGVNDAPALAQADVGIAIGTGTDVAIESAGVILAQSDPRAVLSIIKLSKACYLKMFQNLFWAAGYNVVAIPLGARVLTPIGVLLSPAVGAVLMSVSTIVVAPTPNSSCSSTCAPPWREWDGGFGLAILNQVIACGEQPKNASADSPGYEHCFAGNLAARSSSILY
jgi:cation transport ATPase